MAYLKLLPANLKNPKHNGASPSSMSSPSSSFHGASPARSGSKLGSPPVGGIRRGSRPASSLLEERFGDQVQSPTEVRDAEYWANLFKDKDMLKDPATAERFFAEVKKRLLRRLPTITEAFKQIDISGDGAINFLEWNTMLILLHLPLETRACRLIFEIAAGGDGEISLEEFKLVLLRPTLKKMKHFVRNYKRTQDRVNRHIQSFLLEATESNQEIALQSAERFQRRMQIPFIRQIYDKTVHLHSVAQSIQQKNIQDVKVDSLTFGEMINDSVSIFGEYGLLLDSQVPMLMNIVARVGSAKSSAVSLVELMATLLYMSPDIDRRGKLEMMFDVFDTDQDTVLEDHQLKDLFCLICKSRRMAQAKDCKDPFDIKDSEVAFQEELSNQEGLRNWEFAKWRMHRSGNNEDTVNWDELWAAIQDQPAVMSSLLPPSPKIHWVLHPLPMHLMDQIPRVSTPNLRDPHFGSAAGKRAAYADSRSRTLTRSLTGFRSGRRPSSRGSRPSSRGSSCVSSRPASRSSKVKFASTQGTWRSQMRDFEKDLTDGFKKRLRRLADKRVDEFREGVVNPGGVARRSSRDGVLTRISEEAVSPAKDKDGGLGSAAVALTAKVRPSVSLPNLVPKQSALKGTGPTLQKSSLSRYNSAPSSVRSPYAGKQMNPGTPGRPASRLPGLSSLGKGSGEGLKWGCEAANRYRLAVDAQLISDSSDAYSPTSNSGPDLSLLDNYSFHCTLCGRQHELNPRDQCEHRCEED